MLQFYQSCFDRDTDQTSVQVNGFRLPLKTGDLFEGRSISKFFVEGVLLFAANACERFGYVPGTDETTFAAAWKSPNQTKYFWGELNFRTGKYRTNAQNNFARQGLGLLGLGAAFASKSESFRASWVSFLNKLEEQGTAAVNADTMAQLAVEAAQGLDRMAPDINPEKWTLELADSDTLPLVEDLRNHFVTVEDFLALAQTFEAPAQFSSRFQGPQLKLVRSLIRRRKHTILLGPPGVGKTISAFEALAQEGFTAAGKDYQLFTGHDEVKSADFLGGWQPAGTPGQFTWVNGCLVRSMTAHGGRGQPILVEEFTRMPTRAQNMFISALSDGYVVLNEKPDPNGEGEVIKAGPDFVLLADMNVDPAADDIELYGAAFSSRVRKVEYDYPSSAGLLQILAQDVPETTPSIRAGIVGTSDAVMKRWKASELVQPISPRAAVQWAEEIVDLLLPIHRNDSALVRSSAWQGAELTWLRDVAGTDPKVRKTIAADVEAAFRKAFVSKKGA
jgi:MoxR-like ATPase